MSGPDRYNPALGRDFHGELMAGMKPDKKGGYVTAEDYFNMREMLLSEKARIAVNVRKEYMDICEDLSNQLQQSRQECQDWKERCLERDRE